ncbi:MAG: YdcH family protein, partial [Bryobacteraceae bacterium]
MENQAQEEKKAHLLATDDQFRSLAEQHAQIKKQIEEIESKPHVTGADELEEQRLKKLKLFL